MPSAPRKQRAASTPHLLHLLLLTALAGAAYLPSFGVPFLFDDLPNIVHNAAVHATTLGEVGAALDSPVSSTRPLALVTFTLNHLAGGLDPAGYHTVNLVLHVANGGLLYALLLMIAPTGRDARRFAFLAALLWLLHPVQTQAVTYVVQRMTLIATLGYLVGLLAFVLHRRGRLAATPALLLWGSGFVVGMAGKEIAATLPLACLLLDACLFPDRARNRAWLAGGTLLLTALLALVYLPGVPDWTVRYPGRDFGPAERLLTEPRVLWHYLSLFAWPLPERLHLDYQVTVSRGWWQPVTTLPALAGLGLLAVAGWRLRRRAPLAAFALLFFLLASALEASFVNIELAFVHRLYLPSLFLAAGLLALLPSPRGPAMTVPLLLVAGLLAVATVERNREWRDDSLFWALELERGASPFRALLNRGAALVELGRPGEAARLLERSLPLVDARERRLLALQAAGAHYADGAYPAARDRLEALRHEAGDAPEVLFLLGQVLARQGEVARARSLATQLAAVPGHAIQARVLAAQVDWAAGERAAAVTDLRALLGATAPLPPLERERVTMTLAGLHRDAGETVQERALYRDAVARRPGNLFAWRQLHRIALDAGETAEAARIETQLRERGWAP